MTILIDEKTMPKTCRGCSFSRPSPEHGCVVCKVTDRVIDEDTESKHRIKEICPLIGVEEV